MAKKNNPTGATGLTPEQQQQLDNLRYAVRRCEEKGLTDTAHHEMLKRLESELGLITGRKNEGPKDEVNDGKSDI